MCAKICPVHWKFLSLIIILFLWVCPAYFLHFMGALESLIQIIINIILKLFPVKVNKLAHNISWLGHLVKLFYTIGVQFFFFFLQNFNMCIKINIFPWVGKWDSILNYLYLHCINEKIHTNNTTKPKTISLQRNRAHIEDTHFNQFWSKIHRWWISII